MKSLLFVLLLGSSIPAFTQLVKVDDFTPCRADTIMIERNWRTRAGTILAELEFGMGDTVTRQNLGLSLKKIWNLQNFASVGYRWDSLPDGRWALVLVARDAITVRPVIAGKLTRSDVATATLRLGVADHNFLGRNIGLEMRGQVALSEPFYGEVKLTVPRQLLWKNMAVTADWRSSFIFRKESFEEASINIVNPWHKDYSCNLAPDAETGWLRNTSIPPFRGIWGDSIPEWYHPYDRSFWYFMILESAGTITHRRHQLEGWQVAGMISWFAGLNGESKSFFKGSLLAQYHKLINPAMQLSLRWEGYLSTSSYESMWTRFGPGDIRGILYGGISGPLMQLASASFYYTWLNRDWLVMEQSVFLQYASSTGLFTNTPSFRQHYAVGTGFRLTVPMFPAASILIQFSFNKGRFDWFYLEL